MATDDWKSTARRLGLIESRTGNEQEGKPSLLSNRVHLDRIDKGSRGLTAYDPRLSDFTRLALRLREEGMVVYGFGEQKAVKAFCNACNRFIYVENLVEASAKIGAAGDASAISATKKQPPSRALKNIAKAIEDSDDDGWAHLSGIGGRILGAKLDFNAQSYGCPNLSTLMERSGGFEVRKDQGTVYIRRKAAKRRAVPVDQARVSRSTKVRGHPHQSYWSIWSSLAETTTCTRPARFVV